MPKLPRKPWTSRPGRKTSPRVPPGFEPTPERKKQEKFLREKFLTLLPPAHAKLECFACTQRGFYVWIDRIRCMFCRLFHKLEGPHGVTIESSLKLKGPDGQAYCEVCKRHKHYIYQDRLVCLYCKHEVLISPRMLHYWPLEEVDARALARHFQPGRSTIYRDIKKLKEGG